MSPKKSDALTNRRLLDENEELRARLAEAEETLRAIREGEVDAIVVSGSRGEQIFSLTGSESVYRLIVETMHEAAFTVSLDGNILFCNRQFGNFVSVPLERVIGRKLHEFMPQASTGEVEQLLAASRERAVTQRVVFQGPGAATVPAHISTTSLRESDGLSICIVATDLSELETSTELLRELRHQQEALQRSEARFRSVLDNSLDCIYRFNVQTDRFEYISPSCETIVGYSSDELMGQDGAEAMAMVHPDDLPAMQAGLARLAESGTVEIEYRQRSKDGGYRWLANHMSLSRDDAGRPLHRDGSIRDITERKRVEEALQESRKKYQALIETTGDFIWEMDPDGVFTFCSPQSKMLWGFEPEDMVGKKSFANMPEEIQRQFAQQFGEMAKSPRPFTGLESPAYDSRGRQVFLEINGVPFFDDSGAFKGFRGITRDITARRKVEEELKKSEEKYRKMIQFAPAGIYEVDFRKRVFTSVNDVMCQYLGYSEEELLSMDPSTIMGEDSSRLFRERIVKQLAGEQVPDVAEYKVRAKNGREYYALLNVTFTYENGRPKGAFVIAQDITERKVMEKNLRDSEATARALLRLAPAAIYEIDFRGRCFISVNDAMCSILGYTREELLSVDPHDILDEESRAVFGERIRQQIAGERIDDMVEYKVRRKDGTLIYAILNTTVDIKEGVPERALVVAHDITGRKIMEEELRRAKEELEERVRERTAELSASLLYNRTLIEASMDPMVIIGTDGKITDVNASAELVTGVSREGLIGTDFLAYFTEPERARAGYETVFRDGSVRDYPLEIRHRDGHVTSVLYNASVYRDGKGEIAGVLADARDITDLRLAQAALQEVNRTLEQRVAERTEELARSNRELEQFAYVASHDLQEPLRNVGSFVSLLQQRYGDRLDTSAGEFISFAMDGVSRMQSLIKDLLAYSRVGTRGSELTLMDPAGSFDLALANLRESIRESLAEVTCDALPAVCADRTQLAQLFQNLIGNALKFRSENRPAIHVGARRDGDVWVFSVSDNGIGIEPEYHDRIFLIFQRLHTRDKYPGTGVGLAICKKIVERHGGTIWIESEPGRGSTFFFTIPVPEGNA